MADVDTTLVEQIFDITKRKWKSDIHHHSETNYLRRRFKIAKRIVIFHPQTLRECCNIVKMDFNLTEPISEVQRYTKAAEQKVRAERVRERVDGHAKNKSPQTY